MSDEYPTYILEKLIWFVYNITAFSSLLSQSLDHIQALKLLWD